MIRGTYGRGGSGKSLRTVRRLWGLHRKKGREVFSNTPLVDLRVRRLNDKQARAIGGLAEPGQYWPADPLTFGRSWASAYVTRWEDIYDLFEGELLLDEIGAWMPSDAHRKIPEEFRRFLAQDRREGLDLNWTHRTQRVFHEVLDNTAMMTRCIRYGPMVFTFTFDPQAPADKPLKEWFLVSPMTFDLYDTFARVGNASGEGYGQGRRRVYGRAATRGGSYVYVLDLETVTGEPMQLRKRLRPSQVEALVRWFGPESVGIFREEFGEQARYIRGENVPFVPDAADDPVWRAAALRGLQSVRKRGPLVSS